jgi:hypothetical protein
LYLIVQLWRQSLGQCCLFKVIHGASLHLALPWFAHIPSVAFLYAIPISFTLRKGNDIEINTVTVSPSPQSKDEENEKLHKLRKYARDFRRQHTTDAEQFDWDSDDGDYGLAIGRLVVT